MLLLPSCAGCRLPELHPAAWRGGGLQQRFVKGSSACERSRVASSAAGNLEIPWSHSDGAPELVPGWVGAGGAARTERSVRDE